MIANPLQYAGIIADKFAFVGLSKYIPPDVSALSPYLSTIHPVEFPSHIDILPLRAYYNNPFWVDLFAASNIIVCSEHGQKSLDQHPEYHRNKDIFLNGEFWTFIGVYWPGADT